MSVIILKKSDSINELKAKLKKGQKKIRGVNTKKYAGIIKLREDPVDYQARLRNEWDK